MSDLVIYAQSLIHVSASDEQVVMDEKPEFLSWVEKSNQKAREIINGSTDRIA